jgi:hypothetical protein
VPADPNIIGDRITRFSDKNLQHSMSRKIQETVQRDYGWDNILQRYVEIYHSF